MRNSLVLAVLIGLSSLAGSAIAQEGATADTSGSFGQPAPQINVAAPKNAAPAVAPGVSITNSPESLKASGAKADQPGDRVDAGGAAAAKEVNEFQGFVAQSTGRFLPLFGYDLFGAAPSTFAPVDRIPVTADYVVGPGDEVVIRAWGQIDIDYRATVDRNGDFYIPRVGNINLAGVKYQDLQPFLKAAIGRVFRGFDLSVNLGQLRSIQVYLVGQANRPGSYTVSSMSTLVNTLFASGGPSVKGSMRRIQLKRDNRVVTEFDMYDLLIRGDKSKDVRLLPGDVIYIPAIGPLAAINGSVNAPAIYELKGKQTLEEFIALSGGLTTTAAADKITLERITERKRRVVAEFKFDQAGLARTVDDGDLVTIVSVSPRFDNAVTLRGNVAAAARYPWKTGMRLKDLIPDKQALITSNYWMRKNSTTNVDLSSTDQLQNDVKTSIAEVNWDYAVIERLNPVDLTTSLIPFNLGDLLISNKPEANLALLPGDVVTIFSKDDIQVPVSKQTRYVRLEGEINQAGVYKAHAGETLRQLANRVGSLSPDAYLYASEFTRESVRVMQQKKLDEMVDRMERDSERETSLRLQNVLGPEDSKNIQADVLVRKALFARLRQVRATGRILLELGPDATVKNLPDVALEDGDKFVIPSRPSVVSVLGAVYSENSFLYKPNKRVGDYLSQAGGLTKDADTKNMYVLKADGSVKSKRQAGWLSGFEGQILLPGDTIVVPEDTTKTTLVKTLQDWTQILYQFGLGAAAIAVLK